MDQYDYTKTDKEMAEKFAYLRPCPKTPRIKLSPAKYKQLAQKVMDRDGNKCLCCGKLADEAPHHIIYKSEQGNDVKENLASIDSNCHHNIHHGNMYEVVLRMCDHYGPKKVIQAVLLHYASKP